MKPGQCIAFLNGRGQCTRPIQSNHTWHLTRDCWLWDGIHQYVPPKRILDRIRKLFRIWDNAR